MGGARSWSFINASSPIQPSPRLYTQTVVVKKNGPVSLLAPIIWYVVAGHDINTDTCLSDVWLLDSDQRSYTF